jgi:GTP:adenosylcobinamide-phosphate guanylyltransferase
MNDNHAIDTASRFGEIPFVDFTKDLVTGVFDSLVEAHMLQMEEYANFVNSLTQDLSTYINNTQDGVTFDQISEFVLNYDLPQVNQATLDSILDKLANPTNGDAVDDNATNTTTAADVQPADASKWWGGLINGLSPAIDNLVDKINDPTKLAELNAISDYNNGVLNTIPNYQEIQKAISALIVSNKYGLLQTMANQGMMRLVVTEGEIETKITFSTWNESNRGSEFENKNKKVDKLKLKKVAGGGIFGIFRAKTKRKNVKRVVTVNTAKSYQRDSSGTKVDIFGRVLIRFKTDYAPLNG